MVVKQPKPGMAHLDLEAVILRLHRSEIRVAFRQPPRALRCGSAIKCIASGQIACSRCLTQIRDGYPRAWHCGCTKRLSGFSQAVPTHGQSSPLVVPAGRTTLLETRVTQRQQPDQSLESDDSSQVSL
jgi:hypothetical protein